MISFLFQDQHFSPYSQTKNGIKMNDSALDKILLIKKRMMINGDLFAKKSITRTP